MSVLIMHQNKRGVDLLIELCQRKAEKRSLNSQTWQKTRKFLNIYIDFLFLHYQNINKTDLEAVFKSKINSIPHYFV